MINVFLNDKSTDDRELSQRTSILFHFPTKMEYSEGKTLCVCVCIVESLIDICLSNL